ncbi:MAG: hypothetical protein JXM79_09270, partial [Sedimentisphaerales bacterium]|nr:hypothetical protein [Sedimentisphaerales bacterium]
MPKDIAVISGTRKGPQDNIPRTKSERNRIKESTRRYVDRQKLVAPLSIDELKTHSDEILRAEQLDLKYRDFTAIILSNSVWRDSVAGIPYDKRLLL